MKLRHPHFKSESSRIKSNNPKIVIFQFNGKPKTLVFEGGKKLRQKELQKFPIKLKIDEN